MRGRPPRPVFAGSLLLLAAPLLANGGTLRVADAEIGGYRVSVYTDPTPPRPDSLDVSVLVLRPGHPGPVDGLEVTVRARWVGSDGAPGASDGRSLSVSADRAQADDPRYYAAKFSPGLPGEWLMEISVEGPEGRGEVAFRLELRQPGLLDRPWVVAALALLPLALLAWWLMREPPAREIGGAASS